MTAAAALSVWADPEAAQAVLASTLPTVLVGLDVTLPTVLDATDIARFAVVAFLVDRLAGLDRPARLD